jgi:hypothetical protein
VTLAAQETVPAVTAGPDPRWQAAAAKLAEAHRLQDEAHALMIRADLAVIAPRVWQQLTEAEAAVKAAEEALAGPVAKAEEAERRLAEGRRRAANIADACEDDDIAVQLEAESLKVAGERVCARLERKAAERRRVLAPLEQELAEAKRAEDAAIAEGGYLVAADADPLNHPYGFAMPGHLVRMSTVWPEVIAGGDDKHPLWAEAWGLLRTTAIGAGVAKALQVDAIKALLGGDERLRGYWPALIQAGERARLRQNLPPPQQIDTTPAADVMAETWAALGGAGLGHQSLPGLPGHGHDLQPYYGTPGGG